MTGVPDFLPPGAPPPAPPPPAVDPPPPFPPPAHGAASGWGLPPAPGPATGWGPPAPPAPTPTGERPHPLTPVVRAWLAIVAVAWFSLQEVAAGGGVFDDLGGAAALPWWAIPGGLVLLVMLGLGWWEWWTTRFVIDAEELRIEHRGLVHESKRIAYQRVQSVDVRQPFAARVLGLAELTIDVGADSSTRLAYLGRARAVELRDHLMARAHGGPDALVAQPPGGAARPHAWDDLGAADRVLVRLSPAELIVGALLAHELWLMVASIGIPMLLGVAFDLPLLAVGTGIVPLLLAAGGFLSRRVVSQFNYTLAETPAGLKITRGLTTLASQTVPVKRIQAIRVSQPLLWRLVGRYRIDIVVLGLGELTGDGESSGGSNILLPIGDAAQVRTALHAIWPRVDVASVPLVGSPPRARWLAPFAHPWLGHGSDEHVVVARTGWLTRAQVIVPHARLQSVRATQGPLQRRLAVASVALHTSELLGRTNILHTDALTARRFVLDEMTRARGARESELLAPLPPPPTALPERPGGPTARWESPPHLDLPEPSANESPG